MTATRNRPNGSSSILIVHEDADVRAFLTASLNRAGHATTEATTGDEALDAVDGERPLAVVLEVNLPNVSGYEVCRELKDRFGDGLPIVFLSGVRTESFDRVAGLLIGADDYLVKPAAADELLARLRALTRREHASNAYAKFRLTRREQEVLALLADGLAQNEIAGRLLISDKTVGTHTEHIYVKLGVHNRAQAIAVAYRETLLSG